MENNRINEYVYYLPELHQIKSKVGPGLYRIQGHVLGMRKIATEDTLSPSNIKMRADNFHHPTCRDSTRVGAHQGRSEQSERAPTL